MNPVRDLSRADAWVYLFLGWITGLFHHELWAAVVWASRAAARRLP